MTNSARDHTHASGEFAVCCQIV